jgi:ABC-type transporter Mla subunit MlaD
MALQDLTPQLRTRLSRMERAVGWFVLLAAALLVAGFAYYLFNTASRKGWFIQKVKYQTSLANATGLKVGDPVMLMGFNVGEITRIEANDPTDYYGVTVFFRVKKPYYGYVWSDSSVKAAAADFLGGRVLEITKGVNGVPTVTEGTDKRAGGLLKQDYLKQRVATLVAASNTVESALALLNPEARANHDTFYQSLESATPYWLTPAESPAVTERLDRIVNQVELALPGFLQLTNDLARILANTASAMSNLDIMAAKARPAAENLAEISAQLRGEGALGEWLLAADTRGQLNVALTNASVLMANMDTNMAVLVAELATSLENLAGITSNLNAQVQANTNIVSAVSDAIVHTDELVQGLKRHWLLRSAFKTPKTNTAPSRVSQPLRAPNDPFR